MTTTARIRAVQALRQADVTAETLEPVPSNLNEVWAVGDLILRVCPTPWSHRLEREATLFPNLPPDLPYPRVVAHGRTKTFEWLLMERLPGQPLSRAWAGLTDDVRQEAVHQLGAALRRLHAVPWSAAPADPPAGDSLDCPHQLPPSRVAELLQRAGRLPHVDARVTEQARERVTALTDAVDPGPAATIIHGDLHLENVLWDGERVVALLDLEWARPGAPDLDLDVLLRFCADPSPHVAADYAHTIDAADYRGVTRWLAEGYPELFAHPRLDDRLFVYCLSYDVRELLLNPPDRPATELPYHHPYLRVRRLLDGRSHLPLTHW